MYFYGLASTLGIDRIGRLSGALRLRPAHRHRHQRRESRACCRRPEWKRKAFKRPEDQIWFPGETVNLGIGQGYLLVTPLQLAHVAGMLAERGRNFRPRLVIGMRDANGHVHWLAPDRGRADQGRVRRRTGEW